jgi:uroporphyrinogen decarboxylase
MRQAGRYLPEYRALRAKSKSFLHFCYTPEWAIEVTLQPIRRFGFDASIIFSDILTIPDALQRNVRFTEGEGPEMDPITDPAVIATLAGVYSPDILKPVYEAVAGVRAGLPKETALLGFCGAPWTVATYMIAGRGTRDQGPAHALKAADRATFSALIDVITEATIDYLSAQVTAGAEVVKLFDSWAGSLKGADFTDFAVKPAARIIAELKVRHPGLPIIAFPREAGAGYIGFAKATGADCVALDNSVSPEWAAEHVQISGCVQGNLAPEHMVTGGQALIDATRRVVDAFKGGPHIFNLGHGITPDANPDNVSLMIDTVRRG